MPPAVPDVVSLDGLLDTAVGHLGAAMAASDDTAKLEWAGKALEAVRSYIRQLTERSTKPAEQVETAKPVEAMKPAANTEVRNAEASSHEARCQAEARYRLPRSCRLRRSRSGYPRGGRPRC